MVTNSLNREIFRHFWLGHNPAWFDSAFDTSYPRFNVIEGKDDFTIEVAVPGWKREELSVTLKDNELRIKGSKKRSEGGDPYLHQGLSRKSFDKLFVLNSDLQVESVKLEDGLLSIHIIKDTSKEEVLTIN
jgi:molecular chaperone IbpA